MRRKYNKPEVSVEILCMDGPIAVDCNADTSTVGELKQLGYFVPDQQCDWDFEDGVEWGNDELCYNSNVSIVLTS